MLLEFAPMARNGLAREERSGMTYMRCLAIRPCFCRVNLLSDGQSTLFETAS